MSAENPDIPAMPANQQVIPPELNLPNSLAAARYRYLMTHRQCRDHAQLRRLDFSMATLRDCNTALIVRVRELSSIVETYRMVTSRCDTCSSRFVGSATTIPTLETLVSKAEKAAAGAALLAGEVIEVLDPNRIIYPDFLANFGHHNANPHTRLVRIPPPNVQLRFSSMGASSVTTHPGASSTSAGASTISQAPRLPPPLTTAPRAASSSGATPTTWVGAQAGSSQRDYSTYSTSGAASSTFTGNSSTGPNNASVIKAEEFGAVSANVDTGAPPSYPITTSSGQTSYQSQRYYPY
jgi:hypothetical protein